MEERTEERTDFVFDEHILPMDRSIVENKLKSKGICKFLPGLFKRKDSLDERVDKEMERLNHGYPFIKKFFEEIRNQRYCNIEYVIDKEEDGYEAHKVVIKGKGNEIFDINDVPSFKMSEDRKLKWTFLPVRQGSDEFNLRIYEHPQIEIPLSEQLEVKYNFETFFSLGESCDRFTKNPLKTIICDNMDNLVMYFYGKPGKVFYREGDALTASLNNAILGPFAPLGDGRRKNFEMQGQIYLRKSGILIYQGLIESDGTFPFFITKNPDKEIDLEPISNSNIPKIVVSA